ncbi:MAG: 30S ribosomal protein S16 [Nitrospinota bacterium]
MAVKIRLMRAGAKGAPFYRVVVAEDRGARDGRYVEAIGHYDPKKDPPEVRLNEERARTWLRRGAKPTATVRNLLRKAGVTR